MAGKKEYATRFGTFMLAMLFLVTSVGFSILVIWQVRQENKDEDLQSQIQESAEVQTNPTANKEGETVLQGTKLQGFTTIDKVDALQATDLVPGTGAEVKAGDTVTAHYTGALTKDGTIFQSSLDAGQPFTSPLSGLIQGWQQGIPGMKVGGTRRLVIPAAQAYGEQSQEGIPANSDLVFDIQLISVESK